MYALLDRYIARLMLVPLVSTLVVSAMLLLLVRMAALFDLVITEGGTGLTVLRVLANLAPQYLSLGIPLGLLMGVLLAFRRLSLLSELDAMFGMGVSTLRLLKVPMLAAAILATVTVVMVGYVQPLSAYDHEKLLFNLNNGGLGVTVRVGAFNRLGDHLMVRAQSSRNGGRDIEGIFAVATDTPQSMVVFSAARGELVTADDGETMIARLFNGSISHIDEGAGASRSAGFEVYELPINLKPPPDFRFRGADPRGVTLEREMTLPELLRTAFDPTADAFIKRQAEAGLYRRAAQTLVLFLLPLLALPLARPPLRTVNSNGVIIGITLFIIYNELSLFGERLGASGQVEPLPAQAASFLCFAAFSVALYLIYALRPGEPPLSQLSALFVRIFRKSTSAPLLSPAE